MLFQSVTKGASIWAAGPLILSAEGPSTFRRPLIMEGAYIIISSFMANVTDDP